MTKIAVFASGTGTNFEAIHDAIYNKELDAEIVLVVSDKEDAKVIDKAQKRNIATFTLNPKECNNKQEYEQAILNKCQELDVTWLILAGYMRICGDVLLSNYPNRIINIHPSLLPAFKGKDAIGQAIDYGVKVMGVSIHYVNQELDGGAIIAQQAFVVEPNMSHEDIEEAIHNIEHVLYPKTLQAELGGKVWKEH